MFKERQIIMLEGQAEIRDQVLDILSDSMCAVSMESDFRALLQKSQKDQGRPDLFLLDIDLMTESHWDFLERLHGDIKPQIPVVVLATAPHSSQVQKAMRLGVFACVAKPFEQGALAQAINQALNTDIFYSQKQEQIYQSDDVARHKNHHVKKTYRILIVDDQTGIPHMIQDFLEDSICDVLYYQYARVALEKTKTEHFDVILLDMHMPEFDGIEFLRDLRAFDAKTPVMVITSDHTLKVIQQIEAYAVADFLSKPFHFQDLQNKLEKVLNDKIFA